MPRQAKRDPDFLQRVANVNAARHWPAVGGLSPVAGQSRRGGGGRSVVADVPPDDTESSGAGQLLVLSATGDSIDPGGDYLTFDTQVHRRGFENGGTTAAGQSVVWPLTAVGYIQVEARWDSYQGGGKIEVEVDGVVPDWGLLADASSGQQGEKRRGVDITEGSVVKIKVTQTSGSAQLVDVLVEFGVQDPAKRLLTSWLPYAYGDTNVTVRAPADVQAGDLLVAHVNSRFPTNSTPTGWTRADTASGASDHRSIIDYKVATDDDAGALITWRGSGGADATDLSVAIVAVSGIDTADPFSGTIDNQAGSGALGFDSADLSSTVDAGSTLLIFGGGLDNAETSATITAPGTEVLDGYVPRNGQSATMRATSQDATTGAVGPFTVSIDPTATAFAAALVPLTKETP